jgi:predicted amidohydrolase YtcJ
MRIVVALATWLIAGICVVAAQDLSPLAPDAIYLNGRVLTVDSAFTTTEAFAVKDGKFIAVGSNDAMRALAGPKTQQVDLRGRTVIPGLMDNHNHMIWKSRNLHRGISMAGVRSTSDMLDRIKEQAAQHRPGEVIVGNGDWQVEQLAERRLPTRKELDEAAPNNPVFIFHTGRNNASLNSISLKILGIDFNTTDWGSFPILRDEKGEPTGELSGGEQVYAADLRMLPQSPLEEQIKWLEEQQREHQALGITGIRELVLSPWHQRIYYEMHRQGRLTIRVSMGVMIGAQHVDGFSPIQMETYLTALPPMAGLGDDVLQFDGTAAEFEVTTQRVSALNREPYPRNSNNPGFNIARWPHSKLLNPVYDQNGNFYGIHRLPTPMFHGVVKTMNRLGYRPGFHVSGDGALDWHLDAYEAADRDQSIKGKRWVVEHNGGPDIKTIDRIVKLDMILSLQRQIGPLRTQIERGMRVTLGSDYPAFPNNPFVNLSIHITRKDAQGQVYDQSEKISREQALRMVTINNAYLMFKEHKTGSIEAGKLADFVILSGDFMTVPDDEIRSLRPLATFIGGRKVFAQDGGDF